MTDLKLCYNRQLTQIGSIIEEFIRIERKPIKLIAKLLLMMKYHISTVYKESKNYYGSYNDKVVEMG